MLSSTVRPADGTDPHFDATVRISDSNPSGESIPGDGTHNPEPENLTRVLERRLRAPERMQQLPTCRLVQFLNRLGRP